MSFEARGVELAGGVIVEHYQSNADFAMREISYRR